MSRFFSWTWVSRIAPCTYWSNVSGSECIGRCGQLPLKGSASSDLASVCEDCCNKKLDSNCVLVLLFHSYFVSSNKRRIKKRLQMINLLLGYAPDPSFSPFAAEKMSRQHWSIHPYVVCYGLCFCWKWLVYPPKTFLELWALATPTPSRIVSGSRPPFPPHSGQYLRVELYDPSLG